MLAGWCSGRCSALGGSWLGATAAGLGPVGGAALAALSLSQPPDYLRTRVGLELPPRSGQEEEGAEAARETWSPSKQHLLVRGSQVSRR